MQQLATFFQTAPIDPTQAGHGLWLIIALPLLGALSCGLLGRIIGRNNVHLIAVGSVLGSFLISLLVFWTINDAQRAFAPSPFGAVPYSVGFDYGTWFSAGGFRVNLGLSCDHLTGSMLMVITGVGLLIHIYSTEYMSHDDGYWRFFAYLNLFVAAMLTLVLADSLPLMFVGWEGVGLCSYLLIGFWYDDPLKAAAGKKAFITNRIGDFGFLIAAFLLVLVVESLVASPIDVFSDRGTRDGATMAKRYGDAVASKGALSFAVLEATADTLPSQLQRDIQTGPLTGKSYGAVVTVILLLLLLGAAGKSAQIPLYVWLPDAMAGPTPVSALIHAATMVTSGVYMFCRLSYLVVLSGQAMAVIALIGGATALVAALIAFSQKGLKKVLAYSTVSQLGLMFLGIGSGIFWAAFLHVVTHAFFKACLFLGAGSVMHGNGDEEDITKLGGVKKEMPWTWGTFLVATLAITGIVPLSGFFSKDAIIDAAAHNTLPEYAWVLKVAWVLGMVTAACTAFYMVRMYVLTFEGTRAKDAKVPHAHESSPTMTVPLVLLAVLSVVAIAHGLPLMHGPSGAHQTLMENFLDPVFATTHRLMNRTNTITIGEADHLPGWIRAWVIAIGSGGLAFWLYRKYFPGKPAATGAAAFVKKLSFNKFYVDELYELLIINPLKRIATVLYRVVDNILIDTLAVRGTAWVTAQLGSMLRRFQTGDAQAYAAAMALAMAGGLVWLLMSTTVVKP